MRYLLTFFLSILLIGLHAQAPRIVGKVMEETQNGKFPLLGANIFWQGTINGTTTNADGYFSISQDESSEYIIISYTGYQSDTVLINGQTEVNVVLHSSLDLKEVEVITHVKTTAIGYMSTIKVEKIGEGELHKAACCNLSESFETNPSVDVSFTDAVTGTRQIQMLGLAGPYTQITRENMPDIRGLSAIYGFTYTPGTWVESISLIKGTGSVVNGFESIAGQIDVNLWNPESMDRLYLNLFG